MFIYEFKAITKSGVLKKGTVKAKSIDRAKKKVSDKDLYIKSIELNENINSQNSFSITTLLKEMFFLNGNRLDI